MSEIIYLDNAATSCPKPETVYNAVNETLRNRCGNPGRSGHTPSLLANQILEETRMLCSRLFNAPSPEQIIFTWNATAALNIALKGLLKPGDHVIASSFEHNSVARPLFGLEKNGVFVTKIASNIDYGISLDVLRRSVRSNTKLVVCNHISNVFGTVNDISAIGRFCRENRLFFLVDAAQSAGAKPIDVQSMNIDLLAFPGHKSLFGPQGTGGLYIRRGVPLETIFEGGTGAQSESLEQPYEGTERFESGTPNTPGLAGLAEGVRFILETGVSQIEKRETELVGRLLYGLESIRNVRVIGPQKGCARGNPVSIQLANLDPTQAAMILDSDFRIAVRSGLHCSVDAHRTMRTLERGGALRISPGFFNQERDVDYCVDALRVICGKK
ncbi:MAG: aminotransferase class V-fold PLP-dependent enzyme [Planctomycetaceae bacterium]|jgi:cysteine desulfurase family protein|nr:aminotransferase class V-fold PLP-dependent enzyme [Planctomycetaceae bacterium]